MHEESIRKISKTLIEQKFLLNVKRFNELCIDHIWLESIWGKIRYKVKSSWEKKWNEKESERKKRKEKKVTFGRRNQKTTEKNEFKFE